MSEAGVGALSMSEVARRLGMRQPSLYKYFDSLNALYDALFRRGTEESHSVILAAAEPMDPGLPRIRAGALAWVRWAVDNPGLAQLLYWRPVPCFAPSEESFGVSLAQMQLLRTELANAVEAGQLHEEATSEEAVRLYTVVLSGLITQQMANQPGTSYRRGMFTSLTDAALDMFFARYTPDRNYHAIP